MILINKKAIMTNEIQLYIIGVLVLTILVLYIRDYFRLKDFEEELEEGKKEIERFDDSAEKNFELLKLEYNKKLEKLADRNKSLENKNKGLKYSIASYKGHNNRYKEEIKKLKNIEESVQKDCTKNTNLTNKADEKTTSNRKKNTRNEKKARKNEKRKNKSHK